MSRTKGPELAVSTFVRVCVRPFGRGTLKDTIPAVEVVVAK